ncbi:acyl-CoA dehydrogenase family protein [Mycobacterium sp. E2479]|uniref:acyl-CoA dehydrogenase family protein n=1 Tax=Mycobacterium sp. E2479 TaxID=1834134 RepID=UPI0007FFD984|nr:acyl-CoA dehydrogenase family protein [Mycobacterium sp. E2479]OBH62414.1 acyl-CoA dehydrogenase [Mycobacterium sp. E2479]
MPGNAMNFAFTDEQNELRRTVRSFLASKANETEVRRQLESPLGYDPTVWAQMSDQMGLVGLAIPEEFGGQGFSFVELGIVCEEMGRALLPSPYFAAVVLAANLIMHSGDDAAKKRYLPNIASGGTVATLAVTEESGRWEAGAIRTRARSTSDGWVLDGTKTFVLDGCSADVLFVAAHTEAGMSLFAVDRVDSVIRRPLSTLDQTRKQARIEFNATPASLVGRDGAAWPVLVRTLALGCAALAAEQVGGAQRCLELAVDYAKMRRQFGKPIGSFQAIRHKCADVLLDVECARGIAHYAVRAAAELSDELPAAASLAKAFSSDAYARAAAANIQIHGGIGFTWEHPAHLYYKRAKSSGHLLGDATFHRGLLADEIGI